MNEDRKKRGLANGKFFTAVAICALFLGSGNVMAAQTASDDSQGVQEQMQSISVTVTVVDTKGRIRGYNIFISSHSKEKIITGGARKRAAYTLIESKNSGYIGVYFQSQDGNYFYERIKL